MADNIDILVKLFDTLKASTDKNEDTTQQLIGQQHELVNYIKNMPIKDLHAALKEHSKDSKINIDDCSGTVQSTSNDLMVEIKGLAGKVSKMILVVVVAFTIVMGGIGIVATVTDTDEDAHNSIIQNLKDEINLLRKEINDTNTNEKVGG